jgi:Bacterial Ig-like domain (group 3)
VTFTATVSPANATRTVQFTIDGAAAGVPVLLAAGQASYATSGLGVGAHVVAAT